MKELTLQELQNEELLILKDVHNFCVNNNIRYSLYGGTLIGALRHQGFIPWDDDIDIIMPRPDYDRFCREYSSERYQIADLDNNKDYMLGFARVYDDKKTTVSTKLPWLLSDVGVWIDIFPADGLTDDIDEIKRIYRGVIHYRKRVHLARGAFAKYSIQDNLLGKVKLLVKKMLTINGLTAKHDIRKLEGLMRTYDFETSPMWASLSNVRGVFEHKYHSIDTFQSISLVKFEDMKACVMNGADKVLRERYGDYMQLPSESDRVPKQSYIHFYWKDR